nr:hypothetical protein HK105_003053 [Polyrhizophydium stewartii]
MVDFLTSQLLDNAAKRPYVEFSVTHRSGPPELLATYSNGTQRSILVKRKTPSEIQKSLDLLCNSWGPAYAARKFPSPVRTGPGSTLHEAQNQWDPFHAKHVFRPHTYQSPTMHLRSVLLAHGHSAGDATHTGTDGQMYPAHAAGARARTAGTARLSVRIVVVGDPGVGKTSLVHLVCNGEPLQPASGWSTGTRGCTLHVKQHTPRTVRFGRSTSSLIDAAPPPPSPSPAPAVWVEFVDVGGRCNHPASRRPLYAKADGVLLVYDTGSAMSLAHLRGWRDEVLRAAAATGRGGRESAPSAPGGDDAFEVLVGGAAAARDAFGLDATPEMPMLVVGTKSDLVQASLMASMAFMSASRSGPILGADEPKPAIAAAAMPWLSLFSGQRQPLWGFAPSQKSVIEEFDLQSIRLVSVCTEILNAPCRPHPI